MVQTCRWVQLSPSIFCIAAYGRANAHRQPLTHQACLRVGGSVQRQPKHGLEEHANSTQKARAHIWNPNLFC